MKNYETPEVVADSIRTCNVLCGSVAGNNSLTDWEQESDNIF